ncbi:hypothetical protein SDC9_203159 [bioreactor metagenome]|uniref:Rho termination factor-like N-terminal domain-containing protein n=1 Tax=bioreactor metagenome TaxID=1076179 RepID=A0A645IWH2_9ZZZZ
MKIQVKRFALKRNGHTYKAGEVVEIPDDEALALIESAPSEFEQIIIPGVMDHGDAGTGATLEEMTYNDLKAKAKALELEFAGNISKKDLVALITEKLAKSDEGNGGEGETNGLPTANLTSTIV